MVQLITLNPHPKDHKKKKCHCGGQYGFIVLYQQKYDRSLIHFTKITKKKKKKGYLIQKIY